MFPPFSYFAQNCFTSFSSGCQFRAFSYLLVDLFCLDFGNVLFCMYHFIQTQYLFNLPSFVSTFWFISLSWFVCFNCCVTFLFSSQHIPVFFFFLIIFVSSRRLLIWVSIQISHTYFYFLFVFCWGKPIFSLIIWLLYRLARLILWCYSSRYILICQFFQFLPDLFFSLCPWEILMWFAFQT